VSENAHIGNASLLSDLKSEAGAATLANILAEIAKLERLRALSLPPDLFAGVSRKRLLWCKRRIAVEGLSEIQRHPPQVRYSLLSLLHTTLKNLPDCLRMESAGKTTKNHESSVTNE